MGESFLYSRLPIGDLTSSKVASAPMNSPLPETTLIEVFTKLRDSLREREWARMELGGEGHRVNLAFVSRPRGHGPRPAFRIVTWPVDRGFVMAHHPRGQNAPESSEQVVPFDTLDVAEVLTGILRGLLDVEAARLRAFEAEREARGPRRECRR